MSNQKLGILAVVAAVMVFLAVITGRTSMGTRGKASGPAYLIQGLDTAGIDSIRVAEGDKEVKIRRQGQGSSQFVVEDMNYPADTKQINDLITKVLDIKTVDLYTSDVANHKELEVSEEKPRGSIKFFKPDGSLLTGVVIGKTRESGEGTYVREASSNDVYLTNESPYIRTKGLDYVNQEIASVKGEDINAVTVTTPDGSYTLRAQKGGGVLMDGLPADKKLKETDAKSVLTALQGLRFDDVNTPTQITGLTFDRKYVARMNDSTEYTLELAKKGEKTYLLASAVYTDPGKVTINPEVQARLINNGQSCIAAKRFIVAEAIADEFEQRFVARMAAARVGDPMLDETELGPLATPQIREGLEDQVRRSVGAGARVLTGGSRIAGKGNYYQPTVLTGVRKGTAAYEEELFGPVAVLFRVRGVDEAIELANDTGFGLGASVWTNDAAERSRFVDGIESGQVFVNAMVASDPRLPFGGVKRSGYGRELGMFGIREFVNIKTVYVK
jgi:hypothetical protein